jgi:hypothetical protein
MRGAGKESAKEVGKARQALYLFNTQSHLMARARISEKGCIQGLWCA